MMNPGPAASAPAQWLILSVSSRWSAAVSIRRPPGLFNGPLSAYQLEQVAWGRSASISAVAARLDSSPARLVARVDLSLLRPKINAPSAAQPVPATRKGRNVPQVSISRLIPYRGSPRPPAQGRQHHRKQQLASMPGYQPASPALFAVGLRLPGQAQRFVLPAGLLMLKLLILLMIASLPAHR